MSKIKHFIKSSPVFAPFFFVRYFLYSKPEMQTAINRFLGNIPSNKKFRYFIKLSWARARWHFDYNDYFTLEYENLSSKGKRSFIPTKDFNIWSAKLNPPELQKLFIDKYETYRYFKKYYKRKACFVEKSEFSFNEFKSFISSYNQFILKPLNSWSGHGVAIHKSSEIADYSDYFSSLFSTGNEKYIAEEIITSVEDISKLHPSSLNTLRVPTIRFADSTEIWHPFFRVGQNGNVIDNADAGGIFCLVDINTGILFTATDEYGKSYILHPNTQQQLIGYKIPRWEEAKALAIELSNQVPDCKYVGWDLALTDNGWIMIEGNANAASFLHQFPTKHGCRKEMESILHELGIK